MGQDYTSVPRVEIGGKPLPDAVAALLTDAWVDASVNVPSAFGLTFTDPGGELPTTYPQLAVGRTVRLLPVTDGTTGPPMLTGEITAMEIDADGGGRSLLVRGYDPGHRLLRNRRVAGYARMTASAIVKQVAGRAGVPLGRVDPTTVTYDLATQPNITDWDFLHRLARENDVRLWLDGDGELQFTRLREASTAPSDRTPSTASPYVVELGANTLSGRVGITAAGQVGSVQVRGWDVRAKKALTGVVTTPDSPDIRADLTPKEVTAPFGAAELVGTAVPYTTQAQVQRAADAMAHDTAGAFAELEVSVTGNPDLRPGQPIALKGAGFPFEGRYTVTGVRHVFSSGRRYLTRVSVTGRQFRSLYGLAADGAPAPPPVPGVVTAQVSSTKDPEKKNRVKVRFPWLSGDYQSDWCRVAQLGGVRGGGLVLPEVDDEVLVAFDRGSFEHPYVLAGLYNGKDSPTPDPDRLPVFGTDGTVNWRTFASRDGHQVQLLDAGPRASGVRLRTGKGRLVVHLDEARTTVTVHSDGTVRIEGRGAVEVKAGTDLNLTAGRAVSITAGTAVSVRAGATVGLRTAGALTLDAGAATNVKSVGPIALTSPANASITAASVLLTGLALRNGVPF